MSESRSQNVEATEEQTHKWTKPTYTPAMLIQMCTCVQRWSVLMIAPPDVVEGRTEQDWLKESPFRSRFPVGYNAGLFISGWLERIGALVAGTVRNDADRECDALGAELSQALCGVHYYLYAECVYLGTRLHDLWCKAADDLDAVMPWVDGSDENFGKGFDMFV